jgi:hypothetical protein
MRPQKPGGGVLNCKSGLAVQLSRLLFAFRDIGQPLVALRK